MAGIGFKLQKLLAEGTYWGVIKGFFFATFLVAGPWIVSLVVIGLLSWLSPLSGDEFDIFRTSVVYLYAFSLIFTGIFQMPLTRYLADELYAGRWDSLGPSYLGMGILVTICQGLLALGFVQILPLSFFFRMTFVSGYVTVSLLWLAMIYLGCLRDYRAISWIYVFGSLVSLVGPMLLRGTYGLDGQFFGFVLGQALILLGLSLRILQELGYPGIQPSFAALGSLRTYFTHLLVGLFFNCAIWIDKMLFWFSWYGQTACRGLYSFGFYDTGMFLAYATIIPALGMYLMHVETTFYEVYRDYYGAVLREQPLAAIRHRHADIFRNLRFNFFEIVKIQGAITILVFAFAPEILARIHYPPELLPVVRWGIWGAFFQVLFLSTYLIQLYFDFARDAMWGNLCFLVLNGLLTTVTLLHGEEAWFGAGYLVSTLVAFLLAIWQTNSRLKTLIYLTFMGQPIPQALEAAQPVLGSDGRLGEIVYPPSLVAAEEQALKERKQKR